MPDRNWGQIPTGATFESLATTLVFFEDPGAALFGRRGKDGGQDARSSDGKSVFQAKHHQDGSAAKAIADAKKEAAKVAKYRTPRHSREPQWRGVTRWRLVTNAAFNPTDGQTWDSEVVPLFHAQGLVADYWEQANLDALLDKHPEVDRAYFQNATRAFLSLPEAREMLPGQEPFLQRDTLGPFVGRDEDEQILRILAEQLRTKVGRTSQWKIAITVRSPKDPVLKFLLGPRMKPRVDRLPIAALPRENAEAMCIDLIGSGPLANGAEEWRATASKELAKRFSSHPVWLTLAVHVLETTGELAHVPQTAADLADHYLSEVVGRQSDYAPETMLALLRWVALVGTLNRENGTAMELVAGQAQLRDLGSAKKALAGLVSRRALAERGAYSRFVEVKPDVLRDHLLLRWLSVDVGFVANPVQPSDDANALAQMVLHATLEGALSAVERAILESLARTELVLRLSGQPVDLMGIFVDGILQKIGEVGPSTRIAIAELFVDVAAYRPEDTVRLSEVLRTSPCATERIEGIFGEREVGPPRFESRTTAGRASRRPHRTSTALTPRSTAPRQLGR